MDIIRIQKQNLVSEVYTQMYELIATGTWKESEKLASEHQLSEHFNVSRVVIREALQRLRSQHFIVTRQGMGSFVSNPNNFLPAAFNIPLSDQPFTLSEKSFLDLMELRRCIEFRAIELSVTAANQTDFACIQDALTRMEESNGDIQLFSEADYDFHYAIVQSSHNSMFCRVMESCKDLILYCFLNMNQLNDSQNWGIKMHTDAAEKIFSRDAKAAIKAFKQYNEYNLARLSAFFEKNS